MKNILGLDLGTNSVGWALISVDENGNLVKDIRLGSRIIPMSQDVLGKFDSGVTVSQTAERTEYRSHRRLLERALLRRERFHRVLHLLDFLPGHYAACIGWDRNDNATYGKFLPETEPKLAWRKTDDGGIVLFSCSRSERCSTISVQVNHPSLPTANAFHWIGHCIIFVRRP